ncbi:MAG: alpha/beta hydrolase-fold protein [Bacteroidota bacterium]
MKKAICFLGWMSLLSGLLFGQEYERYRTLSDTLIASKHLGFDKKITVTVPFEWQADVDRSFPLIVVFDRQNERSHQFILNTIDYLTSNEQMPSAVIIGIESGQQHRYAETLHRVSSEKGQAGQNEKFLFEELLPLAEAQFHASSFRLFIGHSRYGYFTSSLLMTRGRELNGVISLSPFFSQKNVDWTDSLGTLAGNRYPARRYYRFGIGNDYPEDYAKMEAAIQRLDQPQVDAQGYLFPEADHNVTPGLTIGIALYEIFEEWSRIQARYTANEQKDLAILPVLEAEITAVYGNALPFSLGILNGKGWYFFNEKEYEKAIAAWDALLAAYPNYSEGYLYIMAAQKALGQDFSDTQAKFLASLHRSEIYSQSEKMELKQELADLLE